MRKNSLRYFIKFDDLENAKMAYITALPHQ